MNEVIGESNLPVQLDRSIEAVRLEMSDVRQQSEDEWKEEIERRDFLSSNRLNESSLTIYELFNKAMEKAKHDAEIRCSTEAAKSKYIERHSNIVGVIGPPGVGKSTLSKMIVKCILNKEILPDNKFLFYIYVKDVNFNKKMTLLGFLTTNTGIYCNYTKEEETALVKWLHENPNVTIVFDGLDEASSNKFTEMSHKCQLDGIEEPVDIMKNLFNSTLLPKAKIIVTSRPGQMYKLDPDYRPFSIFEVLGLLEDAKNNLGTQLCGAKYPAIKKILDQQPNLAHLCYLPINFILIVFCLLSNEGSDIKTMTEVLIFIMTRFIESSHLKGEIPQDKVGAEMVKLTHLAYKGLQQRKLVFQKKDFDDVGLSGEMVTNFFHTYVENSFGLQIKILEGNKRSYFTHLTSQEFYAALYLMLFMPYHEFLRQFEPPKSILENTHWEEVLRFMFGVANHRSYKQLNLIFPADLIIGFENKKKFIESIISESLGSTSPKRKLDKTITRRCGWLHEYNDEETARKFENVLSVDLKMEAPTHLPVAGDVVYALRSFTKLHKLELYSNKHITAEVFETLLRGIHETTTKITGLDLFTVKMNDSLMDSLILHINSLEGLTFRNVPCLSTYMERLSNAIKQRTTKIKMELWNQPMNKDDTICLAGCLSNISRLDMRYMMGPDISTDGCRILKEAIKQLPSIQDFDLIVFRASDDLDELFGWFEEFKSSTIAESGIVEQEVMIAETDVMVAVPDAKISDPDVMVTTTTGCCGKCNIS